MGLDYFCRTWATIDLDAVTHNFLLLQNKLSKGCRTMAVVKADAYGHGDGQVTAALQRAGADWAAVSNLEEALSLRRQRITIPILILGYTPPEAAAQLALHQITQTVYSPEYAELLSREAVRANVVLDCHLKVDTGMSRLGFFAQQGHERQAAEILFHTGQLPGLSCTGIFTHFASADESAEEADQFTRAQFDCFVKTAETAESLGMRFALRHCCNSAAAIRFPEMHLDMVRLGVALYGLNPSEQARPAEPLRPAMELLSVVSMVKELPAGSVVSYGRTHSISAGPRRIATVAVGYADGYRRNLGGKSRVLIRGAYAPVIGRVCMDQMMVDVTEIEGVAIGDTVTLAGTQGGHCIPFDELAALNGTIHYEEVCLIARRVPRVYIQNGMQIAVTDYLNQKEI